jgi:SAM-dependent methyltransferase
MSESDRVIWESLDNNGLPSDWIIDREAGVAKRVSGFEMPGYKNELYSNGWLEEQYHNQPMRDRAASVVKYALKHKVMTVFDYGCATGYQVGALEEIGFYADGLDIMPECIQFAKQHNRGHFMQGGLDAIGERRYNLITITYVLEHIAHPYDFLMEIKTHLHPGGYIYIGIPNLRTYRPGSILYGYPWELFHQDHVRNYDSKGITSLLSVCGFTDIETHTNTYLGEAVTQWSHSLHRKLGKSPALLHPGDKPTEKPHAAYNSAFNLLKKPPLKYGLRALDKLQDSMGLGWELVATARVRRTK